MGATLRGDSEEDIDLENYCLWPKAASGGHVTAEESCWQWSRCGQPVPHGVARVPAGAAAIDVSILSNTCSR